MLFFIFVFSILEHCYLQAMIIFTMLIVQALQLYHSWNILRAEFGIMRRIPSNMYMCFCDE